MYIYSDIVSGEQFFISAVGRIVLNLAGLNENKTKSFENFISVNIATRKLTFANVLREFFIQNVDTQYLKFSSSIFPTKNVLVGASLARICTLMFLNVMRIYHAKPF